MTYKVYTESTRKEGKEVKEIIKERITDFYPSYSDKFCGEKILTIVACPIYATNRR